MPNQTPRRLGALSSVALASLLSASVLAAPSARAQAQTQPPPPTAPATTAAPPATPAPSAAVAAVIADTQAKVKAGQFAEAVAALTAAKTDGLPPDDKRALAFAFADTQSAWGNQLINARQLSEALAHLKSALVIDAASATRRDQYAIDLRHEGVVYDYMSQYEKAITYYEQALPIFQQVKNRKGEAGALNNLGAAYFSLSQYAKAIDYYGLALPIYREVKNLNGEAGALDNLGNAYLGLSQYAKAIDYYGLALAIFRQIRDSDGEAEALDNLGLAYDSLSQYAKAIGYYEQALPILRQVKDRDGEASVLNNLGLAYDELSQYAKAIGFFEQALPILRQVKDRNGEASALGNLGNAYRYLSRYAKAIGYYEQALAIFQQVKDRDRQADALDNLAQVWSNTNYTSRNPDLAILFGKQAVNVLQTIRADQHDLDKQTQQGFARSKESFYRDLADLLIAQHRLPEALQVLDLLKQEVYLNFNKPASSKSNASDLLAKAAELTPRETRWDKALRSAGDIAARDEAQQDELARQKEPTPQQKGQLAILTSKVAADEAAYRKTLADLTADFERTPDPAQDRLSGTSNARDLQSALRRLGHGSVALYTLVTNKNIDLLLVTPNRLVAKSVPLTSPTDLDHKIVAFRALLQDPYSDPRPLGKQLYDNLIAPIKPDLDRARAQTLLVALDGNLRYIPLAALSPDGKHYLVESYRTALYPNSGGDNSANGGRDIANVAVLTQRKGAAAVLASLWSVNDDSTKLLMRDFYRDRKEVGGTTAEALRQAQLSLLTGSTTRPSGKQIAKRSDLLTAAPRPHAKGADAAPEFVPNPQAPFAHPFYWAPFILIGNWK